MEWYEYIIMVIAIGLVLLPIILPIVNKRKGKPCSGSCCCCSMKAECHKNFKEYVAQTLHERKMKK